MNSFLVTLGTWPVVNGYFLSLFYVYVYDYFILVCLMPLEAGRGHWIQMAVSYHVNARDQTLALWKSSQCS